MEHTNFTCLVAGHFCLINLNLLIRRFVQELSIVICRSDAFNTDCQFSIEGQGSSGSGSIKTRKCHSAWYRPEDAREGISYDGHSLVYFYPKFPNLILGQLGGSQVLREGWIYFKCTVQLIKGNTSPQRCC